MPKAKIVKGKVVPAWFLRDLKVIDPSYFVDWNQHYEYFEIKRKMHQEVKDKHTGKRAVFHDPVVATHFTLTPKAIESMKKRQYLGRMHSGTKYLNWIVSQNKIEKEKRKLVNRILLAEAMIDFHKFSGKHSVTMGGKNDQGTDKNGDTQPFKGILDRHGRPFSGG